MKKECIEEAKLDESPFVMNTIADKIYGQNYASLTPEEKILVLSWLCNLLLDTSEVRNKMRAEHEARSQGGSYSINRAANKTDKSHKVILSKGKSVKKRKRKNISNQNNKAQKKNKLHVLRPYKKIMPKVSSKKLGFKKEDMEINDTEWYVFQRYAEKFEAHYSKAMLAFMNGKGTDPGTFQDYVAGGGVTILDEVKKHDPFTNLNNFPTAEKNSVDLDKSPRNYNKSEHGVLSDYTNGTSVTIAFDNFLGKVVPHVENKSARKKLYDIRREFRKIRVSC